MDGERFRADKAKFFGDDIEIKSQGSVFQANKAAFFGGEKKTGFKIQATSSGA